MWLSQNLVRGTSAQEKLQPGVVTVGGASPAVLTDGEKRNLKILSPGGYFWHPDTGDDVLVLKNGEIIAKPCECAELKPGEVCIKSAGGAEIRLSNDGNIYIKGNVIKEGEMSDGDEAI